MITKQTRLMFNEHYAAANTVQNFFQRYTRKSGEKITSDEISVTN